MFGLSEVLSQLSQNLPPLLQLGGCPTTESPWLREETLKRDAGPESNDMEVPTRGAAHRCASVSQGFLHRNCVLSIPSKLTLNVVLRKHIDFCLQLWKVYALSSVGVRSINQPASSV